MNRPYLTPRDLADATGDHGAIGEPPLRNIDADDFDGPSVWNRHHATICAVLCLVIWAGTFAGIGYFH